MTPRPDSSHWRQCDDDDCLVCIDRREEFEAKAREMCLSLGLPLNRRVAAAAEGDSDD